METRRYERLGREVSRIGLAATGLYKRPDVDPAAVERAIGEAIDRGITVVDTAPYLGDSEEVCGQALKRLRAWEKVALVTKVPPADALAAHKVLLADDDGVAFRDPLPKILAPAYLEERIERSLKATKLEVLPVALLEGWHDSWLTSTAWPEIQGTMARLTRKGKVLRWGLELSAGSIPHTEKVLDDPQIAVIGAPYCLWSSAADKLAAMAEERGCAFFARRVMGQGGLSGEIVATREFRPGDIRREIFGSTEPEGEVAKNEKGMIELSRRIAELAAFTKSIPPAAQSSNPARQALEAARRDLANRECETVAELAVRFVVSHRGVASAVIGMSSAAHVRANVAAAVRGPLPDHVLVPLREWVLRYTPAPPPVVRDDWA